jgi:hypothetical protein
MKLHLLQDTSIVSVYYDSKNDWLFADWHGNLNLAQVKAGCFTLAQCFLERPCPHFLNNNSDVTSLSADVAPWLAQQFLPYIGLGGVQFVAWVSAPSLLIKTVTSEAVRQLASPMLAVFDQIDEAYTWLQQTRFHQAEENSPPLISAQRTAALAEMLADLAQQLERYRQAARPAPEPDVPK